MKELASSLAELVAIIMIMITLAVSSAAVSSWMGGEASAATAEEGAAAQTVPDIGARQ